MSSRNGDKSRYRINQKRKLLKRVRTRALMATLRPAPATDKKPDTSR